mgnify:CR=1 FL=1
MFTHQPVMINETIKNLVHDPAGTYLDCTFGGGGYSRAILNFPETRVIGIDRDTEVIPLASKLEKKFKNRLKFYHLKFSQIEKIIQSHQKKIKSII